MDSKGFCDGRSGTGERNLFSRHGTVDHSIYVAVDRGGAGLGRVEAILTHELTQQYVAEMAPKLEDGYLDIRSTLIKSIPIHEGF